MVRSTQIAVTIKSATTIVSLVLMACSSAYASDTKNVPAGLHTAIAASRMRDAYAVKTIAADKGVAVYEAINQRNNLRFAFKANGMAVSPVAIKSSAWKLQMSLCGYGYEGATISPADSSSRQTTMSVDGNRIEYRHAFGTDGGQGTAPIVEWYINDDRGLEQGFTLSAPPARGANSSSPLRLELGIEGDTTAKLSANDTLRFVDSYGRTVLRYSQLHVFDATGRELPSHLDLSGNASVAIVMNDHDAVYPLTVDPIFDTEVKVGASDGADGDRFGISVSISGDIAVVGAFLHTDAGLFQSGAAYIYSRNQGGTENWGEVIKLTASDAANIDFFGGSVSISGDTIVIGAHGDDDGVVFPGPGSSGSAYIFQRNFGGADNWGEVTKLNASDAAVNDFFGSSVSISSDVVIVGAPFDDHGSTVDSGSAYIFHRNQGGIDNWGEVAKLTASDAADDDRYGISVSIGGDTAIVGADHDSDAGTYSGSAYIYQRNLGGTDNWGEVAKLTASDAAAVDVFGRSVSINGDMAIVGAAGKDDVGFTSGSAYIFDRNVGGIDNWGELIKITASDASEHQVFGISVSIDGDMAVVGANNYIGNSFGVAPSIGSAYTFQRDLGGVDNWGEVTKHTASDAMMHHNFGESVSISDGVVIVGAPFDKEFGSAFGDSYIYFEMHCGNGNIDTEEMCDGGLGCTGCQCDSDYESTMPTSLDCQLICSNGSIDSGEQCDDGNTAPNDGCDANCQIELGACCTGTACSVISEADCAASTGTFYGFNTTCNSPDADGDGLRDECDECPNDSNKILPGICGCGRDDFADSDGDGVPDCNDQCLGVDDAVFAPECAGRIPTVSTWGLVVMVLLLLVGIKIAFGGFRSQQA